MVYANSIMDRLSWRLRGLLHHRPNPSNRAGHAAEPVHVIGLFSTGSGVGQSARSCADALEAGGYEVRRIDVSGLLNQADMVAEAGGDLLDPSQNGLAIVHLNPPEFQTVLFRLGLRRWHNWRIIAYWVWELDRIPQSWTPAFDQASTIWTPSRFVEDALQRAGAPQVRTVSLHVPVTGEVRTLSPEGTPLSCLIMADGRSSLERKNLLGSLEVFYGAFPEGVPARLVIKLRNLGEYSDLARKLHDRIEGDPRVSLIDATLSRAEIEALYMQTDVLISCHRAEGFGLHLAEAMARGVCVLATDWSGNLDFMDAGCAALVPSRLVEVTDPTGIYSSGGAARWAEPDLDTAAGKLAELSGDRALLARIAGAAPARISETLGPDSFSTAMRDWIGS